MKLASSALLLALGSSHAAFVPSITSRSNTASSTRVWGYLDDLSKELYKAEDDEYNPETESREATEKKRDEIDRYGPGNLNDFVEFDEFDGGDGQMGVAGDGQKGLEKMGSGPTLASSMSKSKMMSAKNAWGTSTGYADELLKQNKDMDTSRAQQLENWRNQREIHRKRQYVDEMVSMDSTTKEDEDWRTLAKFGVERTQDFDLNQAFGAVTAGDRIEDTIELKSMIGRPTTHSIPLKNPYMGFADFRAAFTPDSSPDFTISPTEGSIKQREYTDFVIRFTPNAPGVSEATLVIETEDFKNTYKIIGGTA